MKLSDLNVRDALKKLHDMGPKIVIISSVPINNDLILFGSIRRDAFQDVIFKIMIPKLPRSFTGTGDVFTALIIGFIGLDRSVDNVIRSCEASVAVMQKILQNTLDSNQLEIDLIGSTKDIINPPVGSSAILL